jgi:hypothetical protein
MSGKTNCVVAQPLFEKDQAEEYFVMIAHPGLMLAEYGLNFVPAQEIEHERLVVEEKRG